MWGQDPEWLCVPIGLAPGTAASLVTMPLLQAVRAELPEALVYLHENSGSVLNDKLLNGQLDTAVLYDRSPVAADHQPAAAEGRSLSGRYPVIARGQSIDLTAVADEPVSAARLQCRASAR